MDDRIVITKWKSRVMIDYDLLSDDVKLHRAIEDYASTNNLNMKNKIKNVVTTGAMTYGAFYEKDLELVSPIKKLPV